MLNLGRVSPVRWAALCAITAFVVVLGCGVTPALAVLQSSTRVALIPGAEGFDAGTLQTTGTVTGSPEDSFEKFQFSNLAQAEIDSNTLSGYDTVVLNEVFTESLSETQKQALSTFVTNGGKLVIHDSDGTTSNNYAWLPVPADTGQSCQNCGNLDGQAEIVENNSIVSNEPSSPYYVNVAELPFNSDAVGDANMLVTSDPRWAVDIRASNDHNSEGAVDAYASDGGLILYNGFDTDSIGSTFPAGNDWLNKIWYDELNQQWNPDNLPHSTPVVGTGGHCGYRQLKVGVTYLCAESISGSLSETTASGNVVLDGGISVGNGPVQINQETKQISVAAPAPLSLLRGGAPVPLGTAAFTINATGATDPTSGKTGLATVSFGGANLAPLGALRVGELPFSLPITGSVAMYLDNELGGGLIGSGTINLPMLGKLKPSGALSIGVFAGLRSPVTVLGGKASFATIDLGKGWKFNGFELSYQQATDTWSATGGLEAPIGSLQASGSLIHEALDSLQVSIGGQNIPLADSGFFFSGFGGGFSGLVNGPLKIDASTAGYWGAPKLPVEPFYLDNVTVTVNFGGSISLDGAVSFVFKDHSPIHGALHLRLGIHPFSATGRGSLEGELPGVSLKAQGGAGFTAKHFTAAEGGSVKLFGLSGSGTVIASDAGMGASGTLCAPFHVVCKSMAFAGTWKQIGALNIPAIVGGDPQKLVTVPGVTAAGQSAAIRVPPGRTLLLVSVSDVAGAPEVRLRAPGGKVYRSTRSTRTVLFTHQPAFNLTTIAVVNPRAGVWRVSNVPGQGAALRVKFETVHPIQLIHASSSIPPSSSRHPLAAHSRILLRWSSHGLPRGIRVVVVRHSKQHELGVSLAHNLGANGQFLFPPSKLAPGRNYFTLAATLNGVPFQVVAFPGSAWRAQPKPKKHPVKKHARK
jgi:hypothetical protein